MDLSAFLTDPPYIDDFVFLTVPPYIDDNNVERNPKVVKGRHVTLNCPAMGIPYPTVQWFKENVPIEADIRHHMVQRGRQLRITAAQEEDTGSYTCMAMNIAGQARRNFNLHVLGESFMLFSLSPFSPLGAVSLCEVLDLAETFPCLPVSDPFLPNVPGSHVPSGSVFQSQPRFFYLLVIVTKRTRSFNTVGLFH